MRELSALTEDKINMLEPKTFIYANTNKLEKIMKDPIYTSKKSDKVSRNKL